MKRCYNCKLLYPVGDDGFCANCGGVLTELTFWDRHRTSIIGVSAVLIFTVLIFLAAPGDQRQQRTPSKQTGVQYQAALNRFREKLNSLPRGLILSIEGSPVEGVARVQVSNVWFNSRPHERRQLTQLMANLWSSEMKGEPAILHIYDITGREIAGTKAFGGVWTEDDR